MAFEKNTFRWNRLRRSACVVMALCVAEPAMAGSRLSLMVPMQYFTKTTDFGTENVLLYSGIGGEYAYFLTQELTLNGQFEVNLNGLSAIFVGTSVGASWYFIGGDKLTLNIDNVRISSSPAVGLFAGFHFVQKLFNFRPLEGPETGGVKARRGNDVPQGSFIAPKLSLGMEMGFGEHLVFGLTGSYIQSFSDPAKPSIQIIDAVVTVGYRI